MYVPKQLRDVREMKVMDFNAGQKEIRDGIYELFAGAGTAITPDYYGLLNATTEFFCHKQPSKRPIAESAMFGTRNAQMIKMVDVLKERIY